MYNLQIQYLDHSNNKIISNNSNHLRNKIIITTTRIAIIIKQIIKIQKWRRKNTKVVIIKILILKLITKIRNKILIIKINNHNNKQLILLKINNNSNNQHKIMLTIISKLIFKFIYKYCIILFN